MTRREKIERAVERIAADLAERAGLGNEWDMIDEDVQVDLKTIWVDIIEAELGIPRMLP